MSSRSKSALVRPGSGGFTGQASDDLTARMGRLIQGGKADECWPWIGARSGGYGQLVFDGKGIMAHRYVHEVMIGPIPDGYHVHHMCMNKLCCNPLHLVALTPQAHMREHAGLIRDGVYKRAS